MIENPMVLYTEKEDKPLAECKCCGLDLFYGETAYKIGSEYFCEDCVEKCDLDEEDFEPYDPGEDE